MSATSSFAHASHTQSVCQTSAFIGSGAARSCCRDGEAEGGFAGDLASCMQVALVPLYVVPVQLTGVVTEAGAGYAAQGTSSDSMMQLLQELEGEIGKLSGELQGSSHQSASCANQSAGLQGDYASLYSEAIGAVQEGSAFDVTLPSGETLSGTFSCTEIEQAGDNNLFTPGNPSAPDAGKQAFDAAIEQFLELAQSDSGSASAAGQIANYSTTTSFAGNNSAMSWTADFSLAPADAIPKTR
jgi:hypothetical protein